LDLLCDDLSGQVANEFVHDFGMRRRLVLDHQGFDLDAGLERARDQARRAIQATILP
jgi:hypothetical protein